MDNSGFDFKTILLLKLQGGLKPKKNQMLDGLKVVNLHAFCFIFDMEDNKLCLP